MIIKKKKQQPEELDQQTVAQNASAKVGEEVIDLFDLDNIDFKQRSERRRGDRRRGFRRIDDRNLISRAREEAEAIREAAAKEGYQEGIDSSAEDIAEVRASIVEFMDAKQKVFDKVAPEILSISIDIARKIIKKELTQSPELLFDSVLAILKDLSKEESKVTIRTNPSQVNFLKGEIPAMVDTVGLDARIIVIPEETVMEGGCIVTTTNGVVDATIETQLTIISEALKEI